MEDASDTTRARNAGCRWMKTLGRYTSQRVRDALGSLYPIFQISPELLVNFPTIVSEMSACRLEVQGSCLVNVQSSGCGYL